ARGLRAGLINVLASAGGVAASARLEVLARTLVINEVLADPPDGAAGDANRDGRRDGSEDEFVELVNATGADLGVAGWTLRTQPLAGTRETVRHTFAEGSVIPAGRALVLFGGGDFNPLDTAFGGAQVLSASTGRLSLTNGGLHVIVRDAAGNLVTQISFGGEGVNQSLTRSPDITGGFAPHTAARAGRRCSPGVRADGSVFRDRAVQTRPPLIGRVEVTPAASVINRGGAVRLSAAAFDDKNERVAGAVFEWTSGDELVAAVEDSGLARGVGVGETFVTATTSDARGVVVSGRASLTARLPVVINEVLGDVPPDTASTAEVEGDANRDGRRDGAQDEFVELFNYSAEAVDLSGVQISDALAVRYTFPAGTVLAAESSLVLFGGGDFDPLGAAFGGALVLKGKSLGLNDAGDAVTLKLPQGGGAFAADSLSYSAADPAPNQSLTRAPDSTSGEAGGPFVPHKNVEAAAGRAFSPGLRADGTPFGSPPLTRIELSPPAATLDLNSAQTFSARAFALAGAGEIEIPRVLFRWDAGSTSVAGVSPSAGFSATVEARAAGTTTVRARAGGIEAAATVHVNPAPTPTPSPSPTPSPTPAPTPPAKVVISQVYGGGGNAGATFTHDFVELFNRGDAPAGLRGWSVQYASATGGAWQVSALPDAVLLPGQYLLVREDAGRGCENSPCGADLPPPDASGTIPLGSTAGKVALVNHSTRLEGDCPLGASIIDFVGYGSSANCSEGGRPAPA
ncbi:MAG: lamin tail domain-containing protein, partial [Acidobacteriota bacterium]|nr:lamin tail domain-containing protein [Acidobacteriota bacterium]